MSLSGSLPVVKPTFSADFVNTERVDHRLTFARASTATFYDGVTTVKAEENLIKSSQEFDIAAGTFWYLAGSGVTSTLNNQAAPDGTNTADTITTTVSNTGIRQDFTFIANTTYTISAYAKTISGSTGFSVDLQNSDTSPTLTLNSNWQRFTWTITPAANRSWIDMQLDGAGSFALWGVQVEQRSSVTAYTATTTAPITNYIHAMRTAPAGVGRIAHDPITRETLGLHMESAATNLLTYSSQFDDVQWVKIDCSVLANTIIAPDGTLTGATVVFNGNVNARLDYNGIGGISPTVGSTYTYSVWLKGSGQINIAINTTTGTGGSNEATITLTNSWVRYSVPHTFTSGVTGQLRAHGVISRNTTTPTVYVWGAQVEAGGLATSYIPTVASQVTRAADTCTLAAPQFDAAIRQGEGTLYAEVLPTSASGSFDFGIANLENGVYNNLALRKTAGVFVGYGNTNGVTQFELQLGTDATIPYGVIYKAAVAYAANNFGATSQGLAAKTDSLGVPPGVSSLRVGPDSFTSYFRYNNYIRKVAYYPTRLANLNLEALTL